jgi:flagellar motility protein MotE (MotC chaperone)
MAKAVEEKLIEEEKKPYNKLQWFLFLIVIPLLFTITIALIVLTIAGVNVFELSKEYSSKIPLLSKWTQTEEAPSINEYQSKVIDLEAEIKDREALVAKLEDIIESRDQEIQNIELEKQRLEDEIKELRAVQEEDKRAFKDIIKTYETISPKKAAPILTSLSDEEAVKILSNIKADTLAKILEQMEPEDAARLTQKLTVESDIDQQFEQPQ